MAVEANWLMDKMEEWAPVCLAEEWDNVGLLIGSRKQWVTKVLVALDVTAAVSEEAVKGGYDWVISHHPLIYNPLKRITEDDALGKKIILLIENGIGLYCSHTNLDKANGGVNDILFDKLELTNKQSLLEPENEKQEALGRVGTLPDKMTLEELVRYIESKLGIRDVRYAGQPSAMVSVLGLCAGDAGRHKYFSAAKGKKCDAYITGDLSYHNTQEALEMGLPLIDITHFAGENLIVNEIVSRLRREARLEGLNLHIEPSSVSKPVLYR